MRSVPTDQILIAQARKRGGDKAAARVAFAIRDRQIAAVLKRRHELRDSVDRCWPPGFLRQPAKTKGHR